MSIIVHPFTAGADGKPAYTADQYRRTNTVWLAPIDTTTAAASTGVSGIRNEVNGPICTLSGTTITVKDHAGIVYPFRGGAPYTYFVQDESVTLDSATQSYKIALVVTDPSAGIGTTAGATIQAIPSTTPDSNINGLVLAQVVQGVVSDVAPRLLSGTTIQTQTLTALQQIKTTDGQKGRVATTGDTYTYLNGAWVADKVGLSVEGPTTLVNDSEATIVGYRYGRVVMLDIDVSRAETAERWHNIGYLPDGWEPMRMFHIRMGGEDGTYNQRLLGVFDNGAVEYEPVSTYQNGAGFSQMVTYICAQ